LLLVVVRYQGYFLADSCALENLGENRKVGQDHFFLNSLIIVFHCIVPFFLSDPLGSIPGSTDFREPMEWKFFHGSITHLILGSKKGGNQGLQWP
jgi:hypothetical protein